MHDCQKPLDMLVGYVIISLDHSLDSVFFSFKEIMACISSYLFQLFCPLSCSGTSYEMLLFVRLE
jgi:hypothetical protein